MTTFDSAFGHVVSLEGGYSNDPNDRGGETKFGISKRAHPDVDIQNLTLEQAKKIYYNDYWLPCKCDGLQNPLNVFVFDAAVNHGVQAAILMLQTVCKVTVDGKIGPKTIAAAQGPDIPYLFMAERAVRYNGTPGATYYLRGWLKRIFKLTREA